MFTIMQQTQHISDKVKSLIALYDKDLIGKAYLTYKLKQYLTEQQIKELYDKLGVY